MLKLDRLAIGQMEVIAIGGFFHDLNFTYLDTNYRNSLICVEEERFSRKKQHSCLNQQSTSVGALEYINQKRQNKDKRIDLLLLSDKVEQPIYKYLIEQINPLEILKVGHHRSHAGNIAFFNRNLSSDSKIFIFDAFGDGHSGAVYHNALDLDDYEMFEAKDSIGLIYTAATKHLGLGSFGSEGKMQGLASYGEYRDEYSISRFLNIQEKKPLVDSTLALNKYGPNQQMYASSIGLDIDYFHEILECRFTGEELNQDHKDFAYTIQRDIFDLVKGVIEENLRDDLYEHTNIGIGGGLGQNSSLIAYLNQQVERGCFVTSTSCSDRGNSLGAMYSNFKSELDKICTSPTPFLGYDADLLALDNQKEFTRVASKEEAVINAAKKLADNQLLCTFISRAEYGARALGNRSILANPSNQETRDVLNRQVKHRELYRPFAAIVLPEECPRYLLLNKSEPLWMTECIKVKSNLVESCPSAVHIDETCRVQIAHKDSISPIVRNLLEITTKEHKIPAIINTSLNDAGEAIVNNLQDLVKTMKSTGIKFVLTVDGLYELKENDN